MSEGSQVETRHASEDLTRDEGLRIRLIPEIVHKLMDRKDRDFPHLSPARFQADAEIAFEFPFLLQRLQRFEVVEADMLTRFEFNRCVIAQDKVDLKAGL